MLSDGLRLVGTSIATNFAIESDETLPASGNTAGKLFYRTGVGAGLYVYNGTAWALVSAEGGGGFSGDYNDLVNKPVLFSGAYADLTGQPTLFSGNYADLTGKPVLFSGAFTDLTGKPTTLAGYGITDAQALDLDLSAIAGLTGTSGLLRKTGANAWELDTAASVATVETVTATQGQTVISLTNAYTLGANALWVSLNGALQVPGVDYTETTSTSITFTSGLNAGDVVLAKVFSTTSILDATATAISYNQGGTGAVPRFLAGKLQESFSVKDFGAVGNGTTDDTTAVQAALNHLKANGGTLTFVPGKYKVTAGLTLIETTTNSSNQTWVIEGNGATLDFSASGLTTGSLLKCGATDISTVHEAGFLVIRNLRIIGPEPSNVTVVGGITNPTPAGNTVGLHLAYALDVQLENIYIRRCYKGVYATWCWPINAYNVNCASNYVGIHLGSTCTLGTWIGCTLQNAAYGLVLQPDADDDIIDAQTFIGLRLENSLRGITLDPRDLVTTALPTVRHIQVIAPRFEQIAYDLVRMGFAWEYSIPSSAGVDRTNYTQAITLQGGEWDDPVGPGTHYSIRGSSNGAVRGCDFAVPVGIRANINGAFVATRMFLQNDVTGGADSGSTYFPDGSPIYFGGNRLLTNRQTGWTAGTGTPQRGAFAALAAGTASGTYAQTELQNALNRIAALEGRVLALQTDLEAHGLIGP